jgi:hypothetical protein
MEIDFRPLVVLAYIGIATVVLGPLALIAWLIWRFVA